MRLIKCKKCCKELYVFTNRFLCNKCRPDSYTGTVRSNEKALHTMNWNNSMDMTMNDLVRSKMVKWAKRYNRNN